MTGGPASHSELHPTEPDPSPTRDGPLMVPGNDWSAAVQRRPARPPEISVVVPYFEAPAQLDLVLAALSVQTHPATRTQVIVADDGSATPPRVPPGVTVVRQPDRGFRAAAARNLGARAADGEVLAFLDADTVPEPGYLEALSALPAVLPDAVVVGRRRHAELGGWGPARLLEWFSGGSGPQELPEPRWLSAAYADSQDLLVVDDRSYRYVISAVLGLGRELFWAVGGFEESFTTYGGEDWELAHRLFTAGAVLAHRPAAIAWHDGLDWAGRGTDPAAARRQKNAETRALARLVPDAALRGPGVWTHPGVVVIIDGTDADAVLLGARSALAGGLDAGVWTECPALVDLDPRLHAGPPPVEVTARAHTVVRLSGPLDWAPGELARLIAQVRPGGLGQVRGRVGDVGVEVSANRALNRVARCRDLTADDQLERLFGCAVAAVDAAEIPAEPDLTAGLLRR